MTQTGIETAKSKVILQNIRVFAVDQTVQRSPDGGEERTIAKTVSLMLTPEQASKLSLAEQIGEVSLIPRNPDDEESSADAGSHDRRPARATATRAAARRNRASTKTRSRPTPRTTALLTRRRRRVPAKPPFRMEIVEAQDVREVLFDADTGKPIRDAERRMPAARRCTCRHVRPAAAVDRRRRQAAGAADADKMLDDFPIDFNGNL